MGYVQGMCDLLAPLMVILEDGMYTEMCVCVCVFMSCGPDSDREM